MHYLLLLLWSCAPSFADASTTAVPALTTNIVLVMVSLSLLYVLLCLSCIFYWRFLPFFSNENVRWRAENHTCQDFLPCIFFALHLISGFSMYVHWGKLGSLGWSHLSESTTETASSCITPYEADSVTMKACCTGTMHTTAAWGRSMWWGGWGQRGRGKEEPGEELV